MLLWFGYGLAAQSVAGRVVRLFPHRALDAFGPRADARRAPRPDALARGDAVADLSLLRWPSALPSFFAGLRITLTYSVTGAIFAEYVGGFSGLGILLQTAANSRATPLVFAIIVVIALLSTLHSLPAVTLLERLTHALEVSMTLFAKVLFALLAVP